MAHKRPFDEVVNEVSSKHPRQDGPSHHIISCNDNFSLGGASEKLYDSGEPSIQKEGMKFQEHGNGNGNFPETPREAVDDIETDVTRSASLSHWATSSTSDEDEPPEVVVCLPFFSGYFSFDPPVRSSITPEDVYHCLLDYPPWKRVPVGPEHQAEIPGWNAQENESTSDDLGKTDTVQNDNTQVEGVCIMPSPKIERQTYNGEKVGDGRTHCSCLDQGSIRCVRQHITEARDKLRGMLGQNTFTELGFDDMGEVVVEKWSTEDEQLFHEVVSSNPASLGKNFWNVLTCVFHSRTKMEIVSYYFNVFMLRKRAEQNRCDLMNIDSDNDEWQGSDDDVGNEVGVSYEDEDSGVESPAPHDDLEFHQNGLHSHEDVHEGDDNGELSDEALETNNVELQKPDTGYAYELLGKKPEDDRGENDVQDGSCTSSDSGASVQGGHLKPDGCRQWHEYIIGTSDVKAWDGYNLSCSKSNEDFLPTCSMIEEVFGDGGSESKTKRW